MRAFRSRLKLMDKCLKCLLLSIAFCAATVKPVVNTLSAQVELGQVFPVSKTPGLLGLTGLCSGLTSTKTMTPAVEWALRNKLLAAVKQQKYNYKKGAYKFSNK